MYVHVIFICHEKVTFFNATVLRKISPKRGKKQIIATATSTKDTAPRVGLAQLVRFLVLELIYLVLNPIFNIGVTFMANYYFSGR
jgi:hypothetical protein